jgi:two-component system, LytTR family, response regulator
VAEPIPATIRAVVVDDEPAARDAIRTLLADEEAVALVAEATNGDEAVEVVRRTRPDLLFLDIQMPDRNGFQVLEALGADVPRGIIFVTAHDAHALRAFEVHALDYLLKPFGRNRFRAAVARALERLRALDAFSMRSTLDSIAGDRRTIDTPAGVLAHRPAARPRRLGVRDGTRTILVDLDAIHWLEACDDYVRIHTGGKVHLLSERMHVLEGLLDPAEFVRIHRSVIVRLDRIGELHREADGGGTIVLRDAVRLRVARGRWDALTTALRLTDS